MTGSRLTAATTSTYQGVGTWRNNSRNGDRDRLPAMAWVLDIDGVVWLAGNGIPGSADAIRRLRAAGERVVFLTNNSGPTLDEYIGMLAEADVEVAPDDLVTSAKAAASMLLAGSTAAVVGGAGVGEALIERGVKIVAAEARPDAVVVGRAVILDYDHLAAAATAIRNGSRFVGTNSDPTFPTPTGPLPGAGAVIAFVATASGRSPEFAGKPSPAVATLVKERFGVPTVMVGDRADTDGAFATLVGAPFALVLSGSTSADEVPDDPAPALVGADLADIVDQMLARRSKD
jgi:HAD superfamily hydrolase (TIGR01450 family)